MTSFTQAFLDNISDALPAHLDLNDFIKYSQKPLRSALRINTLKISVTDFLQQMQAKGWQFEPIPWCDTGFWFDAPHTQAGNCIEHQQGLFYIQEASSMLPPEALLTLSPADDPELILDMAAAPGSKTTQIAAMMQNNGLLIANEYSASRVKVLHANLQRTGVTNTAITHFDARVFGEYQYETFDAILLDAPCSGEGTVRKDADALKNWDLADVLSIADTQQALIESAFLALNPNGILVYSTCTLNLQENQAVCHYLKEKYGTAVEFESLSQLFTGAEKATTPEGFLHIWPQIYDSEGFFVARIRKNNTIDRIQPQPKAQKNFPFSKASGKELSTIKTELTQVLNTPLPAGDIWQRDNEFWLFPPLFEPLIGTMRFQRIGIKLADKHKHGIKLRHETLVALGNKGKTIDVSETQAQAYLMGRDIVLETPCKAQGEVIITYNKQVLGAAKHLGNRLKNNLPRELVKDRISLS